MYIIHRLVLEYPVGTEVKIPPFKIHWLINRHEDDLQFVCEYAPSPWDGQKDEPEFRHLGHLMHFVRKNNLMSKLKEVDASFK